jgi:hypothetical protein
MLNEYIRKLTEMLSVFNCIFHVFDSTAFSLVDNGAIESLVFVKLVFL